MFCDDCKKHPATFHLTKIVNNVGTEIHLCAECASQRMGDNFFTEPPVIVANIFSSLLPIQGPKPIKIKEQCGFCKLNFQEFINSGFLGCSECYKYFANLLGDFLRKIHGTNQHLGKIQKRRGRKIQLRRDIQHLREDLRKAVQIEDYEKAAKIRDKIKKMESEIGE
ncbi:MAG: UvrB/UvrC motif-containing protein [Armatimonadetes bacterium]|nr:UvrB/UvrC motif-containing protein [Armatimonadota bacterium]